MLRHRCPISTNLYHIISVKLNFGVLSKHGADVTMSDTSCGSKQQVGAFKSLQIQSVRRGSCR